MNGYDFHPAAFGDLAEIWEYIAEDNLDAADRVIAEIFDSIRALVPFPQQGFQRPDLAASPLRFKLVRDFLIAYAPEEKPLLIIAVLHGRRSPRVISAILKDRH